MSIQNYLNQIKNAIFGKDVRQAIYDAIKQCYDDASINNDNANMEVKLARGSHSTLNNRITENEENIKNNSSLLEQKAEEVDLQVLEQRMNQFASLPEGSTSGDAELIDGRTSELGITSFNIGENIRNFQNIIFNDKDLNIDCGKWEHGTINLSSGINSINATNKFVRSVDKIKLRTGLKIKFEVFSKSYTPKLTLLYYDENNSYIKSLACENREITLEYPNIRLIYFYEGASIDVDMNDVLMTKVTTKVTLDGIINKVPQLKDLLEKFMRVPQVQGTLKASEKVIDFNDYPIGYWFIDSNSESINKLVNAPLDSKYGYYELIAMPFTTNYSLQIAICTNGEKIGIFFRTFNYSTGDTQIKWTRIKSEIDITNNKYFACGDSITWGHISGNGTTESPFVRAKYPYPTVVANSLGLDVTYGAQTGCGWLQVSGNKTAKTIIDSTDFSQYNISTWGFGTNDYSNNQPLGDVDSPTGGNTVCGAIKYCIEKAYRDNPDLILILITPLNASHPGATGKEMTYENNYRYGTPNTQGYTLSDLCQKIVDICDMYNVPCIDNRKGSVVNLRNINNVLIDKLHFRDRSYITYGQFLSGKIGSIFRPFHW